MCRNLFGGEGEGGSVLALCLAEPGDFYGLKQSEERWLVGETPWSPAVCDPHERREKKARGSPWTFDSLPKSLGNRLPSA